MGHKEYQRVDVGGGGPELPEGQSKVTWNYEKRRIGSKLVTNKQFESGATRSYQEGRIAK